MSGTDVPLFTYKLKVTENFRIMKKSRVIILTAILFAFSFAGTTCFSQLGEIGKTIGAGAQDAQILLQSYISPAVNAFGAGMSGGWFNTAEPHKLGGFDITLTMNTGIVPKDKETFLIDDSELTFLKLDDPLQNETSSVAGPDEDGPQLDFNFNGYTSHAFTMAPGINLNYMPSPMVQAGIGLIKGTEVMVRYLPNINISENQIGLWGIGGKHDIKQWIPGLKKLPILQMSVMYGYTKLHTFVGLDVKPEDINAASMPGATSSEWKDQQLSLFVQSQTANLIVSANLPVICFYGSVGFVTTKTNLKLQGEFPTVYLDNTTPSVQAMTDPVNMNIKNRDGSITKPRLNAGFRIKMAVITIHADYSWADYSVLTAGLGVSFR
jgi:hypothetical protein